MEVQTHFEGHSRGNYSRKHNSNFQIKNVCEDESVLEEKLSLLETQYARMEMDYSKKIKELKANLSEKTRKQVSLCSEINGLREDFKITHEEIAKVGEQLKLEQTRETELKTSYKHSSPGLIKKSVQHDKKYLKKQSPSSNQSIRPHEPKGFGFGRPAPQYTQKSSPAIKRYSPKANPNGILHLLKQEPVHHSPVSQKEVHGHEHHIKNGVGKSPVEPKKKALSPRTVQDVKVILANSIKTLKKEKVDVTATTTNASPPRRPIRRSPGSPGEKVAALKLPVKKESKQLLGRLKEAPVEQAF